MAHILGVRTEIDSVLSVLAPLGLAAAADPPSLLIDLDPSGPAYPSRRSLADLVSDGPTRAELTPGSTGMAVLRNGGIEWREAVESVHRLATSWSSITLRVGLDDTGLPWPVIPVVPLLPGFLTIDDGRPAVWQTSERGQVAPGPGPLLPPLGRRVVHQCLEARSIPRGRWVRGWRQVWELPWP
ncbi:MAG TPA: hypothetical protein VFZ06_09710 [Acidimicrobiia bacterium]|nr:hypothetical protein [Acidimicrobiia bacterium]